MNLKLKVERLAAVETGVVSDSMVRLGLSGWMDDVRAIQGDCRIAGPARTLLFGPRRGEGAWGRTMYATIASLNPGDVLVFGTGGANANVIGDNMANFAMLHGLAAMVTDSMIRDIAGIRAISMPVFARGAAVRMPLTVEPVALDVPISCGGAQVRPGDIIVGGEDGVVVVPQDRLDDVLYQIEDVEQAEKAMHEAILAKAPLPTIEAIVKKKKLLRA